MKSKQNSNPSLHPRQMFLEWYHSTTPGRFLQQSESSYLLNALKLTYNQKILQAGILGTECHYIGDEFRNNFALVGDVRGCPAEMPINRILAEAGEFPVSCECIDVLILPHILEFEDNPHRVLYEAERILKPEGQLLILGFNPWSPQGIVSSYSRRHVFLHKNVIGFNRLMEWLSLLKFDAKFCAGFSHTYAQAIFRPDSLMNKSMAYLSAAYAVRAIKRTYTMIPIKPAWGVTPSLIPGRAIDTSLLQKN